MLLLLLECVVCAGLQHIELGSAHNKFSFSIVVLDRGRWEIVGSTLRLKVLKFGVRTYRRGFVVAAK